MLSVLGQLLLSIVSFLVVLTLIVTIHELGHFLVARFFGVLREGAAAGEGAEDGAGAVLAKLVIEPVGPTVHVSTVVPAALVLRALAPEPAVPTP